MRTSIFVAALCIAIAAIVVVLFAMYEEIPGPEMACTAEARICPDGTAVGRTGPDCAFAPCPEAPPQPADDMIVISMPRSGDVLTSPLTVSGQARGNWFFEATAPVTITNWDGLIIGEGYITALDEWMTTDFVPFSGTISYTIDPNTPYDRGTVIFMKSNPSGLPENDDAREIQVTFSELSETRSGSPAARDIDTDIYCTMDANQCPDGSWVGRVPPSCAFAPCPGGGPMVQ